MKVNFKANGNRLDGLNKKAQFVLDTAIVQDTDPYVPFHQGVLSGSVRTSIGTGTLTYTGPYAHFLYKGEVMVSPITGSSWAKKNERKVYAGRMLTYYNAHPLAGPIWFERSKSDNNRTWVEKVKSVYGDD